jgi:hypothetical protein
MKTIKLFLLLLALSSITFYSCSDENPIKNETAITQKSIALRTTLNELKTVNAIGGKSSGNTNIKSRNADINPFCFDFVYPIVLSYNNGTAITIANFEGLIDLLNNESPNLYIEGIVFPFQVSGNGAITTITTEEDFTILVQGCGFETFYDDLENTLCFDIVFPIEITFGGQVTTINSLQELLLFGDAPGFDETIEIVFPINVINENGTVVVNNVYEFYEIVNSCFDGGCVCTEEYAPVCVQTPNGPIVEYSNFCFAQCDGYTQNDLVPCTSSSDCSITNLSVNVIGCNNSDGSYSINIDFDLSNSTATQFQVWSSFNTLVGTYPITISPITINYISPNIQAGATDSLVVKIVGNSSCSATQSWIVPDCTTGCICPTVVNPVCVLVNGTVQTFENDCLAICAGFTPNDFVECGFAPSTFSLQLQDCININYPVLVQTNGSILFVTSNAELLQYYNPNLGSVPSFVYPISVSYGVQAVTYNYNNPADFISGIEANCN